MKNLKCRSSVPVFDGEPRVLLKQEVVIVIRIDFLPTTFKIQVRVFEIPNYPETSRAAHIEYDFRQYRCSS